MQIKRAAPKKLTPLTHPLKTLYKKLLHCSDADLPAVVPSEWIWLKGDIHHWIPVLNRFDTLLHAIAQEYVLPADKTAGSNSLADEKMATDATEEAAVTSSAALASSASLKPSAEKHVPFIPPQPLAAKKKGILMAVLQMTRLLLENCTNRSLYNSYEVDRRFAVAAKKFIT